MKHIFHDKRITGILTILPEQEIFFDQEAHQYPFPVRQTMRLKEIMGYNKHRIVKEGTTVSDLCIRGLRH